ncbi:17604_t:CDS:2, partial [Dentiscutata erythropus]
FSLVSLFVSPVPLFSYQFPNICLEANDDHKDVLVFDFDCGDVS